MHHIQDCPVVRFCLVHGFQRAILDQLLPVEGLQVGDDPLVYRLCQAGWGQPDKIQGLQTINLGVGTAVVNDQGNLPLLPQSRAAAMIAVAKLNDSNLEFSLFYSDNLMALSEPLTVPGQ